MNYTTLSIAESKKLIQESGPLILDCRDLKDYRAGHLENALHVHEGLKDSLVKRGDKQRSLLIYCYYGHATAGGVPVIRKKCISISTIA
jgi:thiosulfate sulfurtransferase